jgi:hypothetical protein
MTTTQSRPVRAAQRSPLVRTGQVFARVQLVLGAWLWLIVAVGSVVLTVIFDRVGTIERSTWGLFDQGPRWFLFSMALILVTGYLPAHVASGMTRRSFAAALGVVMVVTATAYATLWTVGLAVERAVFTARGWPTGLRAGDGVVLGDGLGGLALESLLMFVVYAASGAVVGATYYRAGGWWGTLTLPATVGPVLLAEAVLSGGFTGQGLATLVPADRLAPAVAVVLVVLLAAALAAAAHLVIRTTPLRTRGG